MVILMSIFKYFKHLTTGTELDDHEKGRITRTNWAIECVPIKAIELANVKVANETPHNNRTRPHLMLMPA